MEMIKDTEHFAAFIAANRLPVICFHSPYSAYSRRTVAILQQIAPQFSAAAFGLANVDGDCFQELIQRHAIVALPTVIAFRGRGNTVAFLGERSEKSWVKLLDVWLA